MELKIGKINQHNFEILLEGLAEVITVLEACQQEFRELGEVELVLIIKPTAEVLPVVESKD